MTFALADRSRLQPLANFVRALGVLVGGNPREEDVLRHGAVLLRALIARDDWLPDPYAAPRPERYQQYLLHRDARARFSVVSFVWGPGQATPIHDHRVWGLVGVLRGAETSQRFHFGPDGALAAIGAADRLEPGAVDAVSPTVGDIHRVANAYEDRVSVSIHVYGADIGAVERSTYHPGGTARRFISGYADLPALIP